MPPLFRLRIMASDHAVYDGEIEGLIAPGADGQFGILARHAPMVAELRAGLMTVIEEGGRRRSFAVSSGFLEVAPGGVSVLADAAEAGGDIDLDRARAAEERARQRMRAHEQGVDLTRAEAALQRALARRKAAERDRGVL